MAAMDVVGVAGAILASPSACIATTASCTPMIFSTHPVGLAGQAGRSERCGAVERGGLEMRFPPSPLFQSQTKM